MRDAEHLVALGQPVQPGAHPFRRLAADARVDLVEDERAARCVGRYLRSQSQHDPRELAPRGDARQRPDVFPGVGREVELGLVDAPVRPSRLAGRRFVKHHVEARALHGQVGQPALEGPGQVSRRRPAAVRQGAGETRIGLSRRRDRGFQRFEVGLPRRPVPFGPQLVAVGDDGRQGRTVAPLQALQLRQALLDGRQLLRRRLVHPARVRPQGVGQLLEVRPHRISRLEVRREPGVETGEFLDPFPHAVEDAQRGAVAVIQLRVALGRQAVDPFGVGQNPPLRGQRLVLVLQRIDLVDVAQPQRRELGALGRARRKRPGLPDPVPRAPPARERVPRRGAQRLEACVAIQQIEVGRRVEQRLMLVLAVDVQQPGADGSKPRGRHEPVVDVRPASTLRRQFAAQHPLAAVGVLGDRLHDRPFRPRPHQARRRPPAPQQAQRADENRLAGAGLPRQHREARVQLEFQAVDDRQVPNGEEADHGSGGAGSAIVSRVLTADRTRVTLCCRRLPSGALS